MDLTWFVCMTMLPPESRYAIIEEIFPEVSDPNFEETSFYDSLDPELQDLVDTYGIEAARKFLGDGSDDSGSMSGTEFNTLMQQSNLQVG